MPKTKLLGVRVDDSTHLKVKTLTESRGQSVSEVIREIIDFLALVDSRTWDCVDRVSQTLALKKSLVLANILIKWCAQRDAVIKVRGVDDRVLDEFQMTGDGVITGAALRERRYQAFVAGEKALQQLLHVSELKNDETKGVGPHFAKFLRVLPDQSVWPTGSTDSQLRVILKHFLQDLPMPTTEPEVDAPSGLVEQGTEREKERDVR